MHIELRDSLDNLFSDSQVSPSPVWSMELDVARGGTLAVHVLATDLAGDNLKWSVRSRSGAVKNAQWFRLIDVPVEDNTGLVGFTTGSQGMKNNSPNPHIIRQAPFRTCDAMEPISSNLKLHDGRAALRLHVPVPRNAKPGPMELTCRFRCGREEQALTIKLNVHKATVPESGSQSFPVTMWICYPNVASRHGLKMWSPGYWRMLEKYVRMMVHMRQNMCWIPLEFIFELKKDRLVLNRPRLRRLVSLFTKAGLHYIEGGHLASRTDGHWSASTFSLSIINKLATSPQGYAYLVQIADQLMEEIQKQGWASRWIQHAADEPIACNATDYRILTGMIHKHFPGIRVLDALGDPSLAGAPSDWCPQVQDVEQNLQAYEQYRRLGDRLWYYTCCLPGGAWLNRLLDQELLRPVLLGWAGELHQLDGYLHWGFNYFQEGQNPFEQSIIGNWGGGTNCLPPGDTHIVYPGPQGPWSSLRLEAHREGFEDLELLRLLRKKNPAKAKKVLAMAIQSFDHYTKDVRSFRQARRALLEALD